MADQTKSIDDADREFWTRCFTAAMTGAAIAHEGKSAAAEVTQACFEIADEALNQMRQRRSEPKYQMLFFGGKYGG